MAYLEYWNFGSVDHRSEFFRGLNRPIVFFDLETTGLDPDRDRIVELAAVRCWKDEPHCVTICERFNPGIPILAAATAIHGINNADVASCPRFEERVDAIMEFFGGADLAGYNIRRFDVQMLLAELQRAGRSLPLADVRIVDVCDLFHKREPRTLEGAVRFYCQKEHTGAHGAAADVYATMEVFEGMLDRYPDLPRDVEEIHRIFLDKDSIDLAGKLRFIDGVVCVNFGKKKGRPIAGLQTSYLKWMLDEHVVGIDAEHVIRTEIIRRGHAIVKGASER